MHLHLEILERVATAYAETRKAAAATLAEAAFAAETATELLDGDAARADCEEGGANTDSSTGSSTAG